MTNGFIYMALILFVVVGLIEMMKTVDYEPLSQNPNFYVAVGVLFHLTGSCLLFFGGTKFTAQENKILWLIFKGFMQFFMNGMIAYGIYLGQKNSNARGNII